MHVLQITHGNAIDAYDNPTYASAELLTSTSDGMLRTAAQLQRVIELKSPSDAHLEAVPRQTHSLVTTCGRLRVARRTFPSLSLIVGNMRVLRSRLARGVRCHCLFPVPLAGNVVV